MAVVYHWRHGWIPLDHEAALSKAKGNHTAANRFLGLNPVAADHVPRSSHIVAGHHPDKRVFVLHDAKTGNTTTLSERKAYSLHQDKQSITAIQADGSMSVDHHAKSEPTKPTRAPNVSVPAPKPATPGSKSWRSAKFESDGTPLGDRAAAKVKQRWVSGNHQVIIETQMSKVKTQALLADFADVIDRAGLHDRKITVRVPSGDPKFRGSTAGYVRRGESIVHIRPKIADGTIDDRENGIKNLMPAAKDSTNRLYVLTHEIGHVLDGQNHDTHTPGGKTPNGYPLPPNKVIAAQHFFRDHQDGMSKYGKSSLAEGYAEAFAQYTLGGKGSSAVADAYAEEYRWK